MNRESELELLKTLAEADVCRILATKVRQVRQRSKESQDAFAARAGIALRTYKRFEAHGKATLETFVLALRAIGRTHYLALLFPDELRATPTSSGDTARVAKPSPPPRDFMPPDSVLEKIQRLREKSRSVTRPGRGS